jgi:predicted HicB family RNase H-like nuclease
MSIMTYKGYSGVIEVDLDAGELFGQTVGMRDIITFQGTTVDEARKSFEESVDFYLSCCEKENKPPDRPYSGRFNVRISPEVHRRLAILAESRGQSLNELVSAALAVAAGDSPTEAKVPEPTWQEVKARLEAGRPQPKPLPKGKRRSSPAHPSKRSSRESEARGRHRTQ